MNTILRVMRHYRKTSLTILFVVFAALFVLPLIITGGTVLGVDFAFHYNRFYDAAMQIKHWNFQPYISLYGFQQSGRIVNALYGPAFAYFQGVLVLLAGTWYRYQVLSDFLLVLMGSVSMYLLARAGKVRTTVAVLLAFLFPTTYAVGYWIFEQGFSSWGAALFPLCFIPAVKFYQTRKPDALGLGLSVALMLQVHVLSTFFLVLSYIPLFLFGFVKSSRKWMIIHKGFLAVGIFVALSVNIWYPLLDISLRNPLKAPFVNTLLAQSTTTGLYAWIPLQPIVLIPLIVLQLVWFVGDYKKFTVLTRVIFWNYFGFLFLSTGLFPWKWFMGIGFVKTLQFPFRFFYYALGLLFLLLGLQEKRIASVRWKKYFTPLLAVSLLVGVGQNWWHLFQESAVTYRSETYLQDLKNMYYRTDADGLRAALHATDMGELLRVAEKPTSDYVLDYKGPHLAQNILGDNWNSYDRYLLHIIDNNHTVKKTVDGGKLRVSWESDRTGIRVVPVIVYADSQLELNGRLLSESDFQLTRSGAAVVQQKKGHNELVLSYPRVKSYQVLSVFDLTLWGVALLAAILRNRGFVHAQMES